MREGREEIEEVGAKCANCLDDLEYSANVLRLIEGVIGPRGFVGTDLYDELLFCSSKCLAEYLRHNNSGVSHTVQPRIP